MTEYNENESEDTVDDEQNPYETPLAKEFETHCQEIGKLIEAKIEEAHKALREAQEIADKHGVPFHAGISPLGNSYVPANFPGKTKFKDLDSEVICEIAGVYGDYLTEMFDSRHGGWLHSAVC